MRVARLALGVGLALAGLRPGDASAQASDATSARRPAGAEAAEWHPPQPYPASLARGDSLRAVRDSTRGPVDYLWVVRTSLLEPSDIDLAIARAQSMGVRGLLVQVVGRGDAYYRSDLL